MATIKDIAERVGVSQATVSRVLNYDRELSVNPKTRRQIFEAAEQLNYTKHNRKSTLKPKKIALVQWYDDSEELEDLFYLSISLSIEKKVNESNCDLFKTVLTSELTLPNDTEGIIALGKFTDQQVEQLKLYQLPLIFVDDDQTGNHCSSVTIDVDLSVKQVVEFAKQSGHDTIGIISGEETARFSGELLEDKRLTAFKHYARINDYPLTFIHTCPFTVEGGYQAMDTLLKQSAEVSLPSFLFCSSDAIAIGVLKALTEHHIPVPEQISIMGFNDSSVSKYTIPSLSSVKVYTDYLGIEAVLFLLTHMSDNSPVPVKLVLGTTIVERETTRGCSKSGQLQDIRQDD